MADQHHPFPAQKSETTIVAIISGLIGAGVLWFLYSRGWTNLYGDGQAHVAIARKIVDMDPQATLWERYVQFGSPWLPLQHALMLPLVWKDEWWRNGLAGSFISWASFVVGAVFTFRLAVLHYRSEPVDSTQFATFAPYLAWAIYVVNPTLLYLQATPMTESLFLANLAGSVYFLRRWAGTQHPKTLIVAGVFATLTTLSRYEGWAMLPFMGILVLLYSVRPKWEKLWDGVRWGIPAAIGPFYWFWHNWAIYGRVTEFVSGVYSASGYYARHSDTLSYLSFAVGHPLYAILITLLAVGTCVGPVTLLAGISGIGYRVSGIGQQLVVRLKPVLVKLAGQKTNHFSLDSTADTRYPIPDTRYPILCLLFIPALFTAFSVNSGNIQIYPFFLNVRYGISPLVGLAVFAPTLCRTQFHPQRRLLILALLVLLQSAWLFKGGFFQLAVFQEANRAQAFRVVRERELLTQYIKTHPIREKIIMHSGETASLIAGSGLVYAQIIHEGTRPWHDLEKQLPASAQWILYREGDELHELLKQNPAGLKQFQPVWQVGDPALVLLQRKSVDSRQ